MTGLTVLVVDDQDNVRDAIAAAFEDLGFTVIQAADAWQALAVLADPASRIILLFTDVMMPGMDGQQLAVEALKLRPDLKVIFTSGFMGRRPLIAPFIAK